MVSKQLQCPFVLRFHMAFLFVVFEGYVQALALKHWGMEKLDRNPMRNKMPAVLIVLSDNDRRQWLYEQAADIRQFMCSSVSHTCMRDHIASLHATLDASWNFDQAVQSFLLGESFVCNQDSCRKSYKTRQGFIKHMQSLHPDILPSEVDVDAKKIAIRSIQCSAFYC
jgi:hypothetical protein